jgi:hypothetical protein
MKPTRHLFFYCQLWLLLSAVPTWGQSVEDVPVKGPWTDYRVNSYYEIGFNTLFFFQQLPLVGQPQGNRFDESILLRYHKAGNKSNLRLGLPIRGFGGNIGVDWVANVSERFKFIYGAEVSLIFIVSNSSLAASFSTHIPLGMRYELNERVSIGGDAGLVAGFLNDVNNRNVFRVGANPASGLFLSYRFGKHYNKNKS